MDDRKKILSRNITGLSFQQQINVTLVVAQALNQVITLVRVICVEVMVKLDLARDFLLCNKPALSAQALVR